MNKVTLTGNIGQDPEMRYTPTGKAVTTFSLAVNERFNKADGTKVDRTDWFNIETWSKLAELTNKHFKKGTRVLVEGKLKIDKYEDEGVTKYYTKIVAHTIEVQKWPNDGKNAGDTEYDPAVDLDGHEF